MVFNKPLTTRVNTDNVVSSTSISFYVFRVKTTSNPNISNLLSYYMGALYLFHKGITRMDKRATLNDALCYALHFLHQTKIAQKALPVASIRYTKSRLVLKLGSNTESFTRFLSYPPLQEQICCEKDFYLSYSSDSPILFYYITKLYAFFMEKFSRLAIDAQVSLFIGVLHVLETVSTACGLVDFFISGDSIYIHAGGIANIQAAASNSFPVWGEAVYFDEDCEPILRQKTTVLMRKLLLS